jgi:hypothetical protein
VPRLVERKASERFYQGMVSAGSRDTEAYGVLSGSFDNPLVPRTSTNGLIARQAGR